MNAIDRAITIARVKAGKPILSPDHLKEEALINFTPKPKRYVHTPKSVHRSRNLHWCLDIMDAIKEAHDRFTSLGEKEVLLAKIYKLYEQLRSEKKEELEVEKKEHEKLTREQMRKNVEEYFATEKKIEQGLYI